MAGKILIIEDEAEMRQIYSQVFKDDGFSLDEAPDGTTGLAKAQVGGYTAILLDVMLPGLDGLGVLSELKKNPPKTANGPIILLSNLSHNPIIQEALSLGAATAVTKSDINPAQLLEKVKNLTKQPEPVK